MNQFGDLLAILLASRTMLAEALASIPDTERSEWVNEIVSELPARVTEFRALMEAHPADCPHCAKRQQERTNVQ